MPLSSLVIDVEVVADSVEMITSDKTKPTKLKRPLLINGIECRPLDHLGIETTFTTIDKIISSIEEERTRSDVVTHILCQVTIKRYW